MDFLSLIKQHTLNGKGGITIDEVLKICEEQKEERALKKIRCLIEAGLVTLIKEKRLLQATPKAFVGLG